MLDFCTSCSSSALHARPLQLVADLAHSQPLHFVLNLCSLCLSSVAHAFELSSSQLMFLQFASHAPAIPSSCCSISHLGLVQFVTWTSAIRSSCSSKTFVAARAPAFRSSCSSKMLAAPHSLPLPSWTDRLVAVELGCCAAAELVRCFGLWRCRAGPFGCCRAGPLCCCRAGLLCCCRAGLLCCCHQAELMFSPRAPRLGSFELLLYALMILLHIQTSIGFNSTTANDETRSIKSEREALLAFKRGLVVTYGRLSSWGNEEEKRNCCKWEGVQCDNTTGHIIVLDLGEFQLTGSTNLTTSPFQSLLKFNNSLVFLQLTNNSFQGLIQENLGHMMLKYSSPT
ncbi:hypothetical protein SLEP1_g39186 [Rubroshorea leprosula]|uniref:Leucine-rich repeat-containing N-terminal plant-type domain-containing protein n=1 Tax=Rubroshorea leprosula TaxID=152421 RepID=A0AAV5KZF8_9ROSI|nr:hypothetical protein SLEP1_g39186 [Rubroshorea leprosula]